MNGSSEPTGEIVSLPENDTSSRLRAYIERMETILNELDELKDSIKDLRNEIKSDGFNLKAVEKVVALRRNKDAADKESALINDVLLYASTAGVILDIAAPEAGSDEGGSDILA